MSVLTTKPRRGFYKSGISVLHKKLSIKYEFYEIKLNDKEALHMGANKFLQALPHLLFHLDTGHMHLMPLSN